MADPRGETLRLPTASVPEFIGTFAAILVTIVILLFVDEWLARVDRNESRAHAANLYAEGRQLLAEHRTSEARERFASAATIDRTNIAYQRGLAEATLADARPREAVPTLEAVLDRAETDGPTNLLMARALRAEGRIEEAKSFYHRAIYGRWSDDDHLGTQLSTRFELIDLLARQNAKRELLAELLPIPDDGPDSLALRRRLGPLFIQAGSAERGVELFRKVLRQSPDDGSAYAGMGEAALALGNFRTARADLAIASRLLRGDPAVTRRLQLADTVLALDPLARGIGQRARMERSRTLLALTLEAHDRCAFQSSSGDLATADSARQLLASPPDRATRDDVDDTMLSLATQLWATRGRACPADTSLTSQALALLQTRLAS